MILEKDTYETVLAMLNSPDNENKIMGFEILNQAELTKKNLVYVLFLMKDANINRQWWKEASQDIVKKLEAIVSVGIEYKIFSFQEILRIMKMYDLSEDDYKFYMKKMAKQLETEVNGGNGAGLFKIQIKIMKDES